MNEKERIRKLDEYKYGYRFFYWKYYENNHNTHDDARALSKTSNTVKHEANTGYSVSQLYVQKKYQSLKEELLHNAMCSLINGTAWNTEVNKAIWHIATTQYKNMKCARTGSAEYYEMKYGDTISESHLIAMMVYCGYDVC